MVCPAVTKQSRAPRPVRQQKEPSSPASLRSLTTNLGSLATWDANQHASPADSHGLCRGEFYNLGLASQPADQILTGLQEILTYLDNIGDFWSSLVASDPDSMKRIDPDTVDALQLLAPGKFRTDGKTACGLVLGGQAFAE